MTNVIHLPVTGAGGWPDQRSTTTTNRGVDADLSAVTNDGKNTRYHFTELMIKEASLEISK